MDLGIKRPSTLPFTVVDKALMVMGELDIGLRPAPLAPIIQVGLLDHWDFLFIFMREVDTGIRPDNFLHITMVDYKFQPKVTSILYS